MAVTVDGAGWSGDGDFTRQLVDALAAMDDVMTAVRVEDSPASRQDQSYAFLSNEVFVTFAMREEVAREKLLGLLPVRRVRPVRALSLDGLAARLAATDGVGEPDYQDDGMIQYLRAERVVAPWQTKGIKVVEMVRIYEAGTTPRR